MFRRSHSLLAATVAAAAVLGAGGAHASTVDTFSFSQSGFYDPANPGVSGVLSGSFTGTVEASGYINRADLSSFSLTYTEGNAQSFGYSTTFFSFNPSSASTLDFEAPIGLLGTACSGAAAAFGFDHCASASQSGPINGIALGAFTQALATVSLISSVTTAPQPPLPVPMPTPYPQPLPVSVPEPGTLGLFGTALIGLGLAAARRGRRDYA